MASDSAVAGLSKIGIAIAAGLGVGLALGWQEYARTTQGVTENFSVTQAVDAGLVAASVNTEKEPPSRMSRFVTAFRSAEIAISTGSINTCVTHDCVMPFHSSPVLEPIRQRAFGIDQVTALIVAASIVPPRSACASPP